MVSKGDDPAEANTEFPGRFFADPTSGHEGVEVVVRRSGGGDHIFFGKLCCGSRGVEKRAEDGSPHRMCQCGKACHGIVQLVARKKSVGRVHWYMASCSLVVM